MSVQLPPPDPFLYERAERAKAMTPAERFFTSLRLFDYACEISRAEIRHQHPAASEEHVEEMLAQRIEIQRQLQEAELRRVVAERQSEREGDHAG